MFKKIRPITGKDMLFVYNMLPEKKTQLYGQLRRKQRRSQLKRQKEVNTETERDVNRRTVVKSTK